MQAQYIADRAALSSPPNVSDLGRSWRDDVRRASETLDDELVRFSRLSLSDPVDDRQQAAFPVYAKRMHKDTSDARSFCPDWAVDVTAQLSSQEFGAYTYAAAPATFRTSPTSYGSDSGSSGKSIHYRGSSLSPAPQQSNDQFSTANHDQTRVTRHHSAPAQIETKPFTNPAGSQTTSKLLAASSEESRLISQWQLLQRMKNAQNLVHPSTLNVDNFLLPFQHHTDNPHTGSGERPESPKDLRLRIARSNCTKPKCAVTGKKWAPASMEGKFDPVLLRSNLSAKIS